MAASELKSIISRRYPLQPARLRRFSKTSPGRCDSGRFFSILPTISNIFAEKSDRTQMARVHIMGGEFDNGSDSLALAKSLRRAEVAPIAGGRCRASRAISFENVGRTSLAAIDGR